MRGRDTDRAGFAVNDGVRIYYEVAGDGDPGVLFVPGFQIAPGRQWKMQVPFLAREARAVTYDPRGTGRSDRPLADYGMEALVGDALEVADQAGIDRFVVVAISGGARPAVALAARQPGRIAGVVLIGGSIHPGAAATPTLSLEERRAWALRDYAGWARDWWATSFPEPHSSKPQDDGWEWAQATDAPTLIATSVHGGAAMDVRAEIERVHCPVLLIHGTWDRRVPHEFAHEMQRFFPQSVLVTIDGAGHFPHVRDPVRVNLLLREFVADLAARKVA
ncbi:MAG TPA: alpha/beta hydrolase [bacterium]|jgi:pimeloyl-ACP methyl ester carboxylesterase|nr:alpha/beta hydrolase [bacterium]